MTPRPIEKRRDDIFFTGMILWILAMVFIGFAHTYYMAGIFHAKLPSPLVHVHGAIFTCWLLLLLVQVTLVSAGRVNWHMRVGIFGMILAGLMVIVGFMTLVGALRRHAVFGMSIEQLFAVDVLQLSCFAVLIFWAFWLRTDGAAHKRLVILATASLMGPALSRWPFDFVFSSDFVFYGLLDSFLILMILFDLWSLRKIHRATIWGSLLIVATQYAVHPLGHAAFWHRFTAWVVNS
jgi:hypothetical protein